MAIGIQGQRLPPPQALFPVTLGNPPGPQMVATNKITLSAGQRSTIPPGVFQFESTGNAVLQVKDPVSGVWLGVDSYDSGNTVNSDGVNYCLFNPNSTMVAAVVTTRGDGYTAGTPPAVTVSSGGGTAVAIVGGAIGAINFTTNQTSVTSGVGANFAFRPLVSVAAPASGGVQATAVAVLTGTRIAGFNIINQGAGYAGTTVPITIVPHPDDPNLATIINATAQATTTGSASVTAVLITNNGLGTLTGPPALTIAAPAGAGTQAAAVAVPVLTAVGFTQTAGGSGFGQGQAIGIIASGPVNATPVWANPDIQGGFYTPRIGILTALASASGLGGLTPEGVQIIDGGLLTGSSAVIGFIGSALSPGAVIPPGGLAVTMGSSVATARLTYLGGSA